MLGVTLDGFKSLFTDLVDTLAMQAQIAKPPVNSTQEAQRRMNPAGALWYEKTMIHLAAREFSIRTKERITRTDDKV